MQNYTPILEKCACKILPILSKPLSSGASPNLALTRIVSQVAPEILIRPILKHGTLPHLPAPQPRSEPGKAGTLFQQSYRKFEHVHHIGQIFVYVEVVDVNLRGVNRVGGSQTDDPFTLREAMIDDQSDRVRNEGGRLVQIVVWPVGSETGEELVEGIRPRGVTLGREDSRP